MFKYTDGSELAPGSGIYNTFLFDAGGLLIPSVGPSDTSDFSQEFRFTSPQDQRLRYTAGLYYFQQEQENQISSRDVIAQNQLPDDFAFFCPLCIDIGIPGADLNPIPGGGPSAFFGTFIFGPWFDNFPFFPVGAPQSIGNTKSKIRDYAAFGSVEYDFTDKFRGYAEVRYTDREEEVSGTNIDPNTQNKYDTDYITWRTSLSYFFSDYSHCLRLHSPGREGRRPR